MTGIEIGEAVRAMECRGGIRGHLKCRWPGHALMVAAVVLVGSLVLAGCSSSESRDDLTSRSVTAEDFPVAGASTVPASSVGAALDGLTGAGSAVTPQNCAPARADNAGAAVMQGFTPAGAASFTTGVAYVHDTTVDVTSQARRCPVTTTGAPPATSRVETTVDPAPPAGSGVETAAIRRVSRTGAADESGQEPLAVSSLTLIAQRADVRVYCQYRWQGTGPIPASASAELDALFTDATAAAFR